jgi:hypothetical protein
MQLTATRRPDGWSAGTWGIRSVLGPASDEEARAGLGNHGEAPIVEWKIVE